MNIKINTLGQKIGLGYVLLTMVLAVAVLISIWQISNVNDTSHRLRVSRQPSSRADLELLNGLNRSISEIRGWVLLRKDTFKTARKDSWKSEIRPALATLEELSRNWTNPDNVKRLSELIPMISQMEQYQIQVEDIAIIDVEAAVALMDSKMLPLNKEIKKLVRLLVDDHERLMLNDFANINDQISWLNNLEWILLLSGLIVSTMLAMLITRSITNPVAAAVQVAQNIGKDNLQTDVDVGGSVELEKLGNALIEMRDSLINKTKETQRYDWLTSGQNQLNEKMRGDQSVEELTNNIISFLAHYVNANVGSVYLLSDNSNCLALTGRYSFSSNESIREKFALNEGLIGQAAIEQRQIFLSNLKDDHIRITSSLIEAIPNNLIITPFLFEGNTLGVIELASVKTFDETEIKFINNCMESIGISINSAISRKKIKGLLEETQVQSEELQSQQEELRQINEELEQQTQNLKQQQEELQVTNEELEEQTQVLESRTKEIEDARDEIEMKSKQLEISSRYKSEFLANMSHELRTPLNSLLILSKDLSENKMKNLSEEQVESAQIIHNSGQDLLVLINEVLDLSKIEAGKMSLNVEKITLKSLVDDIDRSFRFQIHQKGLDFNVQIDNDLPTYINTDRQRLSQILRNLISNAIKFTEKGNITIHFKKEARNNIAISVRDTGIGIPESKQATIFEAFQQVDGGISRKYGGTGLGLSISRELCRLLAGEISLSSKVGKGSTFTLTIPIKIEKQLTIESDVKTQPLEERDTSLINYPSIDDDRNDIQTREQVVLIIEDDLKFAEVLKKQANDKGFKCLCAATGEDGLILADKYHPHAIILDIDLPGISGHKVLTILKSNPATRHIPVHIMSVEERSVDPIKEGAIEYLTKPVDKETLDLAFRRIESFIAKKMKNLLIVEDDTNARKAMKKLIGNGDVRCLEAGTGKEALKILKDDNVDCIVLDIGLPDMSGFELISEFENIQQNIPPIVVYTGKELTKEESNKLQNYTESVIIKGIKSEDRLLDETALFLHRAISDLPKDKQRIIENIYDKDAIYNGKKVLITDDDMRNVFALSKILKERGMEVLKADNGKAAIDILEVNEVDLVLIDIMMPEMDGYEAMKVIRSNSKHKSLPILALTAKAMKGDKQKCMDAGANDYITKPIDTDRLLSLMSVWLNK